MTRLYFSEPLASPLDKLDEAVDEGIRSLADSEGKSN